MMVTTKHLLFQNSSDHLLLIQSHLSLREVDFLGGIYSLAEIINFLCINTLYLCHKAAFIILIHQFEHNYHFNSFFYLLLADKLFLFLISLLIFGNI